MWNPELTESNFITVSELIGGASSDEVHAVVGYRGKTDENGGYNVEYFVSKLDWRSREIVPLFPLPNVFF